jgi:hypothetical protein
MNFLNPKKIIRELQKKSGNSDQQKDKTFRSGIPFADIVLQASGIFLCHLAGSVLLFRYQS